MIGKYFFGALAVAILVATASVTSIAQVGELRGTVSMQQADGQKVPLAEAQIDVFRTDIKGEYHTKTTKKGEFVFAGLPLVGTYVVVASHATAAPNFIPNIRVGQGVPVDITVTPGDGKRPTYDEVKNAAAMSAPAKTPSGAPAAENPKDKAAREEMIRKNKEIEEGNKKITEANAVIARTFKAGNDALAAANAASKAQNSDEAIAKFTAAVAQYDEGLAADAEQPAILTNKAVALKGRGVEKYNATIRSKTLDDAGRNAGLESAKADFKAAAESSSKAVELIKKQPTPTDPAEVQRFNGNKYASLLTRSESMRLFVSKVDATQAPAGIEAFKDYIAVETDPAKKAKAQLDSAQMLLDSGQADKALSEFQAILQSEPNNADANLGAGLSLYALNDKTKFQEAANYLQKFVEVAPDSNTFKVAAKEILAELKNSEKIVPEKSGKPAPKKRP